MDPPACDWCARSATIGHVTQLPEIRLEQAPASLIASLDRRFWLAALGGAVAALLVLGIPTALIPSPVFGRQIAAEPWAYAVWLVSAPLAGLVLATYLAPAAGAPGSVAATPERSGPLASLAGLGVFLAVGCPVCNKVALLLLGASGALTVFGPLQPVLGLASLLALAATLAWRLRIRGRACALPPVPAAR
jgi:hypothetical protein